MNTTNNHPELIRAPLMRLIADDLAAPFVQRQFRVTPPELIQEHQELEQMLMFDDLDFEEEEEDLAYHGYHLDMYNNQVTENWQVIYGPSLAKYFGENLDILIEELEVDVPVMSPERFNLVIGTYYDYDDEEEYYEYFNWYLMPSDIMLCELNKQRLCIGEECHDYMAISTWHSINRLTSMLNKSKDLYTVGPMDVRIVYSLKDVVKYLYQLPSIYQLALEFMCSSEIDEFHILEHEMLPFVVGDWQRAKMYIEDLTQYGIEPNPGPVQSKMRIHVNGKCVCPSCASHVTEHLDLLRECYEAHMTDTWSQELHNRVYCAYVSTHDYYHNVYKEILLSHCVEPQVSVKDYIPDLGIASTVRQETSFVLNRLDEVVSNGLGKMDATMTNSLDRMSNMVNTMTNSSIKMEIPAVNNAMSKLWQFLGSPFNCSIIMATLIALNYAYPSRALAGASIILGGVCIVALGEQIMSQPCVAQIMSAVWPQGASEDITSAMAEMIAFGTFGYNYGSKIFRDGNLELFGKMDTGSNSMTNFFNRLIQWFKKVFMILGDHFGVEMFSSYGIYRNKIAAVQTQVVDLIKVYDEYFDHDGSSIKAKDAKFDVDFCTKVKEVDRGIAAMLCDLTNDGKHTANVRAVLVSIRTRLAPLFKIVELCGMDKGGRIEPFLNMWIGGPGVGKTFTQRVSATLVDYVGRTQADLVDYKKNPERHIFWLKKGEKHFDSYCGNSIIAIADAFTEVDIEGAQVSEPSIIINNCGSNADPLPCANLELKGKVFSQNRILSVASNVTHFRPNMFKSIRNDDALLRRCNANCYRIYPLEKYHKLADGFSGTPEQAKDKDNWAIDSKKIPPGLHLDVYEIVEWDLGTGKPKVGGKTYGLEGGPSVFDCFSELQHRFALHVQRKSDEMVLQRQFIGNMADEALSSGMFDSGVFMPVRPQGNEDDRFEDLPELVYDDDDCATIDDYVTAFERSQADDYVHVKPLSELLTGQYVQFDGYLAECVSRIKRNLSPIYYLGDANHAYSVIIGRICETRGYAGLVDLADKFASCNVLAPVASYFACGVNTVKSSLLSARDACLSFVREYDFRQCSIAWVTEHPHLATCCGVGLMGLSIYGFIRMFSNYFCYSFGDTTYVLDRDVIPQAGLTDEYAHAENFIKDRSIAYYMVHISRKDPDETRTKMRTPCSIKFVGDFVAQTVAHLYYMWKVMEAAGCTDIEFRLTHYHNRTSLSGPDIDSKFDLRVYPKDLVWHLDPNGSEFCTVEFPRALLGMQRHTIDDYASLTEDVEFFSWLNDGNWKQAAFLRKTDTNCAVVPCRVKTLGYNVRYTFQNTAASRSEPQTVSERYCMELDIPTINGDCGSEVYIIDRDAKRFGRKFSNPIPVYCHTSALGGFGRGIMLAKELYDSVADVIQYKSKHFPSAVVEKSEVTMKVFLSELMARFEKQDDSVDRLDGELGVLDPLREGGDLLTLNPNIPDHASSVATVEIPATINKSQIKKSRLYRSLKDWYTEKEFQQRRFPIKNYPHINVKGEKVEPLKNAAAKYGTNAQLLPLPQVNVIINKTVNFMFNNSTKPTEEQRKTLSFKEFMSGEEGRRKKPRDSTSCGYTFNMLKKMLKITGVKGRRWLWQNADLCLDDNFTKALEMTVENAVESLRSGNKYMNINMDLLKDELREKEKVEAGKSRLFCAQELVYLIICGMYFYPFVEWMVANRGRNGCLVGVVPYGLEWRNLYERLMSKNDKGIFGDYGSYDKTLFVAWQRATQKLYRKFYGENHPDLIIMDMLFEDMIESYHIIPGPDGKGHLYFWRWGNTSGNFLTTIINCVANYCLITYALTSAKVGGRDVLKELPINKMDFVDEILRDMYFASYGDDNAFTVHPRHTFVTFQAVQAALAEIGIEYTDDMKGRNGEVESLKPVINGTMIGRGFLIQGNFGCVSVDAPLRIYSILESIMWDKTGGETVEICSSKVRNASFELALHGREIYDTFVPGIYAACVACDVPTPEFTCWADAYAFAKSIGESPYDMY